MLDNATPFLKKLAYRQNLTAEEVRASLKLIGAEDAITDPDNSDGLFFLALTFGLMAKGPTADELYGFVMGISDQSVRLRTAVEASNLIDVSGTGGDKIKTFNVGTAASFVIAAGGVHVAKQATRGYTGFTGSADVFRELGMDPFTISAARVPECLEKNRIVAFYTPAFSSGFKNRIDFLTKLSKIRLSFPTPWHLVSWVYSPFDLRLRLYGVFDSTFVRVLAELFQKMDYQHAMVVHGLDGLDELSNVGDTAVAELKDGTIREYTITPEECGIKRSARSAIQVLSDEEFAELDDLATKPERKQELWSTGRRRNFEAFFRVLYGKETGAKRDLVTLNAGAALYLAGKTADIRSGVRRAESLIESGKTAETLRRLVSSDGETAKLKAWESVIGV